MESFRQWSLDARGQALREGGGNLFPQNRVEAPVRPEEGACLGDECIVEGQDRRGGPPLFKTRRHDEWRVEHRCALRTHHRSRCEIAQTFAFRVEHFRREGEAARQHPVFDDPGSDSNRAVAGSHRAAVVAYDAQVQRPLTQ